MRLRSELSDEECRQEFQRVSKDLLEQRVDQGVNYWAGSPYPTMLIWAGRLYEFLRELEQVMGFLPARRPIYDVGYRSGRDGAEVNSAEFRKVSPDEVGAQLLLSGNRVLAGAGWGRCTIEYDSESKSVVWEFPRGTAIGLAAKMQGTRDHPACPFMSGFIAGWTDRSLGLELEVLEVACVACGQDRCRFESREFIRFRS